MTCDTLDYDLPTLSEQHLKSGMSSKLNYLKENKMKKLNVTVLLLTITTAFYSLANETVLEEKTKEIKTFMQLDVDSSGTISLEESAADVNLIEQFSKLDINKDGYLTIEEFNNKEQVNTYN